MHVIKHRLFSKQQSSAPAGEARSPAAIAWLATERPAAAPALPHD